MVAIVPGQGERSAGKEVNRDICIAILNVGTMRGQSNEIVKTLSRRLIDICCVQESRWRVESARKIAGRNSYNTFFWKGNDPGLVTSMIMLVSMANQHQFQSASWWVWLWNTESGRNENARSLCCYRFSCDKYILQKQKLTTSYIQLRTVRNPS